MNSPIKGTGSGIPVGLLVGVLGVIGIAGLIAIGAWSLSGNIKLSTIPVAGEWQAKGKPWRIELRPDKTVVSSTGPEQPGDSQAWTSEPGAYRVDYFGNLWVTLKNGRIYSAALAAESPTRFDLIESDTLVPTVFEKVLPPTPTPPDSPKESPG